MWDEKMGTSQGVLGGKVMPILWKCDGIHFTLLNIMVPTNQERSIAHIENWELAFQDDLVKNTTS